MFKTVKKCVDGSNNHINCEKVKSPITGVEYVVCHDCEQTLGRVCEVFSRVVGYYRPTSAWNKGKKEEFRDRVTYKL